MAEHDVNINPTGLKSGEKLEYKYDDKGRISSVTKGSSNCWVVTAYYGDPNHTNVCLIRDKRDSLKETPYIGELIKTIDNLYQYIGKSKFGEWWIRNVEKGNSTIPNKISKAICLLLLKFAKR